MNPLTWRREHQIALLLGVVLGFVAALVVGFIYNGVHYATLVRIPTIATTHSDGSRPAVPIDRDQCGAGAEDAVG
jgi:xanthine/uracil permease